MNYALLVASSQAGKLQDDQDTRTVAATYHPPSTCPRSCAMRAAEGDDLKLSPCFAFGSFRTRHSGTVRVEESGQSQETSFDWLRSRPRGSLCRLAVSGESLPHVPGDPDRIDRVAALKLAAACAHLVAWTYSHKPIRPEDDATRDAITWIENLSIIAEINTATAKRGMGLTINVSANSAEHARQLRAHVRGLPVPIAFVCESVDDAKSAGFACPALTKHRTCARCIGHTAKPLCSNPERETPVGFVTHGNQAKRALRVVQAWNQGVRPLS